MKDNFPLIAVKIKDLTTFVVTSIDFDNGQVFNTTSQTGSGEWYSFDEVYLMENADCDLPLHDYIFNQDVNYTNYDKIDGNKHIYNNRFNLDSDVMKEMKIKKTKSDISEFNRVVSNAKNEANSANMRLVSLKKKLNEQIEILEKLETDEKSTERDDSR